MSDRHAEVRSETRQPAYCFSTEISCECRWTPCCGKACADKTCTCSHGTLQNNDTRLCQTLQHSITCWIAPSMRSLRKQPTLKRGLPYVWRPCMLSYMFPWVYYMFLCLSIGVPNVPVRFAHVRDTIRNMDSLFMPRALQKAIWGSRYTRLYRGPAKSSLKGPSKDLESRKLKFKSALILPSRGSGEVKEYVKGSWFEDPGTVDGTLNPPDRSL